MLKRISTFKFLSAFVFLVTFLTLYSFNVGETDPNRNISLRFFRGMPAK